MILKDLWNTLISIGYDVRREGKDGLKEWQPHKLKYSNFSVEGYEDGIPLRRSFIDLAKSLDYKVNDTVDHQDVILTIKGQTFDNKIESDHFLIQHFRIPKMGNYKLPLVKILQIAYNIGQLKAVFRSGGYNNKILEFYNDHRLDKLSSYVSGDILDAKVIGSDDIDSSQQRIGTGGSDKRKSDKYYYNGYMKYKKKYLLLKKNGL